MTGSSVIVSQPISIFVYLGEIDISDVPIDAGVRSSESPCFEDIQPCWYEGDWKKNNTIYYQFIMSSYMGPDSEAAGLVLCSLTKSSIHPCCLWFPQHEIIPLKNIPGPCAHVAWESPQAGVRKTIQDNLFLSTFFWLVVWVLYLLLQNNGVHAFLLFIFSWLLLVQAGVYQYEGLWKHGAMGKIQALEIWELCGILKKGHSIGKRTYQWLWGERIRCCQWWSLRV
jgi:hypothetical protein